MLPLATALPQRWAIQAIAFDISQRIRDKLLSAPEPDLSPEGMLRAYHDSDDEKMVEVRSRVDQIVADEITAES